MVENALKFSFFSPSIRLRGTKSDWTITKAFWTMTERWVWNFPKIERKCLRAFKAPQVSCGARSVFSFPYRFSNDSSAKMLELREKMCGLRDVAVLLSTNHPLRKLETRDLMNCRVLLLMRGISAENEKEIKRMKENFDNWRGAIFTKWFLRMCRSEKPIRKEKLLHSS